MRRRAGWRAAERTYRHLTAALAAAAARERAANIRERQLMVCPDGLECADPGCVAAREAFGRGATWRVAFDAMQAECAR